MIQEIYDCVPEFLKVGSAGAILAFKSTGLKNIYSEFIDSGDLVFDVGANIGDYTKLFLDLGAKVVSIEPQPSCLKKLDSRFGCNKKVSIVSGGLSNKNTSLPFFISERSNATSTFSKKWTKISRFNGRKWNKKIKVETFTLDYLISKYGTPSFIKIDVEGYEDKVLEGLTKKVPALSIEFGMEYFDSTKKCIKKLMSIGNPQFNYVSFLNSGYGLSDYVTGGQLITLLEGKGKRFGGDIYVKYV